MVAGLLEREAVRSGRARTAAAGLARGGSYRHRVVCRPLVNRGLQGLMGRV